jgi:tryptophan synthase beta subunit
VEHILPLFGETPDHRLLYALLIGREWERGNATTGDARKASLGAIALANEMTDDASIAVARAAGHAVATAHMADHSMGAALYGLKAVKYAGKSIDEERKWQYEQLPSELREAVVAAMSLKEKHFKL